ncbi:MAG: hypothetical protein P8X63_08275 [Desulfuromonadaceae bacterium]
MMAKKTDLPNLAQDFGVAERALYKRLYETLRPAYEQVLSELVAQVRQLLERQGSSATIKFRFKRFEAYFGKLLKSKKKNHGGQVSESGLKDLLGIRIVCPFLDDLEVIEQELRREFDIVELERKGAQHSFREFGYDSVHLLIALDATQLEELLPHTARVCEIQLRTILQDAWAEVEHELIYKSDLSFPNDSIKRKLAGIFGSGVENVGRVWAISRSSRRRVAQVRKNRSRGIPLNWFP